MEHESYYAKQHRELAEAYKHLHTLERRAAWLATRIDNGEREGTRLTHDIEEREALEWAVETIREFHRRMGT